MPICAKAVQQPDGTLLLALDPLVTDFSTCPYVVESGGANAWRELGNLTVDGAQQIGSAVGLFLAIAWGFKTLGRVVSSNPESES